MNSLSLKPEQFIFAQNQELKTTSLKVAEAFNKRHDNVLRDIDKILTQVSDSFGKLNFELTEYEKKNNLGIAVKYKSYNLTKDGFMFLVMGFTGKKAVAIKESYINAFNLMYEQLFGKPRNTITPEQKAAIQNAVIAIKNDHGIHYATTYREIKKQFHVNSYHELTQDQYPEVCRILGIKPEESVLIQQEIDIDQAKEAIEKAGYIVIAKTDAGMRSLVLTYLPYKLLPPLIDCAWSRLRSIHFD